MQIRVSSGPRDHSEWPIESVLRTLGWDGRGKRSGKWTEIHCPFHEDSNRSAGFSPGLNGFRCHGCGVAGNSVSLAMDRLGLDVERAVEWLDREVGTGEPDELVSEPIEDSWYSRSGWGDA